MQPLESSSAERGGLILRVMEEAERKNVWGADEDIMDELLGGAVKVERHAAGVRYQAISLFYVTQVTMLDIGPCT